MNYIEILPNELKFKIYYELHSKKNLKDVILEFKNNIIHFFKYHIII